MMFNRTKRLLAAGVLVLLVGGAATAEDQDLAGLQLFGPAEVSSYGRGPMPNEGYFGSIDGLYWGITAPETATIGQPSVITREVWYDAVISREQRSTLDTSSIGTVFSGGTRVEFGRIVDHHGWMLSTYRVETASVGRTFTDVDTVFIDNIPIIGIVDYITLPDDTVIPVIRSLPITFNQLTIENKVQTWGVELMRLYRSRQLHNGGFIEFMYGARYLELNEDFTVSTQGGFSSTGDSGAGGSYWFTRAENHVVGPQIGLRYFRKFDRWMVNLEGRFLGGVNIQNARQETQLAVGLADTVGSFGLPYSWTGSSSSSRRTFTEFTPVVELRAELRYQVTRSISIRGGWTGMWMDNTIRGANLVEYTLPSMGIPTDNHRQDTFIHGVTVGIDINR